jgi:type II secretory pathway component PulJ
MRRHQPGFSLVELLVGWTLGLAILACTLAAWGPQLRAAQQLAHQTQVAHTLRTAGLMVSRNLRRAVLHIDHSGAVPEFKFTPIQLNDNPPTPFSYRLRSGVIEMQLGSSAWQAISDARTMRVTEFSIAQNTQTQQLHGLCTQPCASASGICPAQQDMHIFTLHIQAQSQSAPTESKQNFDTAVHLRNSPITGQCSP